MPTPTPEQHLEFLANLQQILDDGAFVATYKYALLMAIADLCVERGDDSNRRLRLTALELADKFIEYYWRQSLPYQGRRREVILRAAFGPQAAVVRHIREVQRERGCQLAALKSDERAFVRLRRTVARIIVVMPLWKLQTVGGERSSFLYPNTGEGSEIHLRPGVAASFRKFHPLIRSVVQSQWLGQVRAIPANRPAIGQLSELSEFLFGSERVNLNRCRAILREAQHGTCLYCDRRIKKESGHVDHFIPWSRYPVDLGHNFVLAHEACNGRKKDYIAAVPHLEKWALRNEVQSRMLAAEFTTKGIVHNLEISRRITAWAYAQAQSSKADTWLGGREFVKIPARFDIYSIWGSALRNRP